MGFMVLFAMVISAANTNMEVTCKLRAKRFVKRNTEAVDIRSDVDRLTEYHSGSEMNEN